MKAHTSPSVIAPGKTPQSIVRKRSAEMDKARRSPAVAKRLERQALLLVQGTFEQFAVDLRSERQCWGDFIGKRNITPD